MQGIYSGAYQQHMTMAIADAAIKPKVQTQMNEYQEARMVLIVLDL